MSMKLSDVCLENIAVGKLKQDAVTGKLVYSQADQLPLLKLVRSGNYEFVMFYVFSSSISPNRTFLQSLEKFISTKGQSAAQEVRADSSPARLKKLFGLGKGKNASKKNDEEISATRGNGVGIVAVDIENNSSVESHLAFIADLCLFYLPPQHCLDKARLVRALGFVSAPSLFVVNCAGMRVVSQAYQSLLDDSVGAEFPWPNPTLRELFDEDFLKNFENGDRVGAETIPSGGVKGLFFGAKWCPPSKQMCAQLCELYPKIKATNPSFEIIFCSSDRSEKSFLEHFSSMPWLSFPYGSAKLAQLTRAYDINAIPSFVLVDEDYSVISRKGRNILLSEPDGYPWRRKTLYELTEHTAHMISELPSLILFTEGSPEDIEFSVQILRPCAEWIYSQRHSSSTSKADSAIAADAELLQVFYTGDDPICDHILESLGQGEELPLLVICDTVAGQLALCDNPDVSEAIVFEFVRDYYDGRSKFTPIPNRQQKQDRTVGGIPIQLIEQLMAQGTEQQQQQQALNI